MRLFFYFLIMILIYSCGKETEIKANPLSDSEAHSKTRLLFSRWRSVVRGSDLNLTNGYFNRSINLPVNISVGTTCDCFIHVRGTESSGTIRFYQCFNRAGHIEDFHCEVLNGYIPYSRTGAQLRLTCFNTPLCGLYR